MTRHRLPAVLLLLLALAGCVAPSLPPGVRPTLAAQWIDAGGKLRWPPHQGFADAPVFVVLPEGLLIDRFGSLAGHFFSPKGASYSARALPYVCAAQPYASYQVLRPLPAWVGKAAAWFREPGGATQFETDASAASLLADHTIAPLSEAGSPPCN
ncbi:MAG: TNT domain-containing protein [Thiohalocapsa sp.]